MATVTAPKPTEVIHRILGANVREILTEFERPTRVRDFEVFGSRTKVLAEITADGLNYTEYLIYRNEPGHWLVWRVA